MKMIQRISLSLAVVLLLASCNQYTTNQLQTPGPNEGLLTDTGGEMHGMGNGGDAVVCYTDPTRVTMTSVQMLDYWEQDQVLHYPGGVDLGAATLSVQNKIDMVSTRIAKFDPLLSEKVKTVALSLANNINDYTVTTAQLPEIDDANPILIPNSPNCYIEQFAVQYKDLVTGQRRFSISDRIYNSPVTDNNAKAGLLLHEAIYRHAILNGVTNSDGVRFYNYVVSTNKIESLDLETPAQYLNIINDAKINFTGCTNKHDQFVGDLYQSYYGTDNFRLCYNQKVSITGDMHVILPATTHIMHYPTGTNIEVDEADPELLVFVNKGGTVKQYTARRLILTKEENHVELNYPQAFTLNDYQIVGPQQVKYSCMDMIVFDKNNQIIECSLHNPSVTYGNVTLKTMELSLKGNHYQIVNWGTIDQADLKLAGSTNNTKIKASLFYIVVDANGNFVSGEISPQVFNFNGDLVEVKKLEIKNGLLSSTKVELTDGLQSGRPIILPSSIQPPLSYDEEIKLFDRLNTYCDQKGYKELAVNNFHEKEAYKIKSSYSTGTNSYYEFITEKTVSKTDEYVQTLMDIKCLKDIFTATY